MDYNENNVNMAAAVAHAANRQYSRFLGEPMLPEWGSTSFLQSEGIRSAVRFAWNNDSATPEDIHNLWMDERIKNGWKYGTAIDYAKKEHPCIVSYDKLSSEQQLKDKLFLSIIHVMRP